LADDLRTVSTVMKPSVSVVITTYNQAEYIAETVLSALNQTYPHREVVVVDDGSTDQTGARLAQFRDRVTIVRQENQGIAASRNTGVRTATGELIAFLDGDDLWEPNKLAAQVAAYQAHPRSGLIAVDACMFSGTEVLRKSTLPWGTTLPASAGAISSGRFYEDLLKDTLIYTTSQVMIPARVLEAVGPSDGRFKLASDYDLYLRIASQYDITFLRQVLTRWRYLATSASGPSDFRRFRYLAEDVAVLKQHRSIATRAARPLVRQIMHKKTFAASYDAYRHGRDHDNGWCREYLMSLWSKNRSNVWPLSFYAALSSPDAFRRAGSAILKTVRAARRTRTAISMKLTDRRPQ
jgi:glycosyltransferase involved in cell wall biosynthesis